MQHRTRSAFRLAALALVLALVLPAQLDPGAALAQETPAAASPVTVTAGDGGMTIAFPGTGAASADAQPEDLPARRRYQGYDLPLELIALRYPSLEAAQRPQITRLESVEAAPGSLQPAAAEVPPVILEEGAAPPVRSETVALPTSPLFVLREGWARGEYVLVVAVSPYYEESGVLRRVTALEVAAPGARPIDGLGGDEFQLDQYGYPDEDSAVESFAAAGTDAPLETAVSAVTVKLRVSAPGLQSVAIAGLGIKIPENPTYGVSYLGTLLPVQVAGGMITFYAPVTQDRWNPSLAYLLTVSSGGKFADQSPAPVSPAVATRAVAAPTGGSPARVLDNGVWRKNRVYYSNSAGVDGDHYFAALLDAPANAQQAPSMSAALTDAALISPPNSLPLDGSGVYTLTVTQHKDSQALAFTLDLKTGGQTRVMPIDTQGLPTTSRTITLAAPPAEPLAVALRPSAAHQALLVEQISYSRQAILTLGGRGALFGGQPGETDFPWREAAAGAPVWDVTDAFAPVVLTGVSAAGFKDSLSGRTYIVGGAGFSHTPAVEPYSPLVLSALPASHALYIVPNNDYVAAINPLLQLRRTQTCRQTTKCVVTTVDVRTVYDAYGFGNVSPDAIRDFLKDYYARYSSPRLRYLTLVGDGTWDPHNYEARPVAPNLIPPYMHEDIDPWLGEAICDRCYGQLDGDDPNTGDIKPGQPDWFVAELLVGRLPVKSTFELTDLVNKMLKYERAPASTDLWRSTVLYVADNYIKAANPQKTLVIKDDAGDFAQLSDEARALYTAPAWPDVRRRIYYDPIPQALPSSVYPTSTNPSLVQVRKPSIAAEPWRVANPAVMRQRVQSTLNAGPAIVLYTGHANEWAMGRTESAAPDDAIFKMGDEALLTNLNRPYVQLSMTCATGQFARPAETGSTIDEVFLLNRLGGPVAIWGPTGWGVTEGHDSLQAGFFKELMRANGAAVPLGLLVEAGYEEILFADAGHTDVLRTFLLLGDPLTRIRFTPASNAFRSGGTFLPYVNR